MYSNKDLYELITDLANEWNVTISEVEKQQVFAKVAFSDKPIADINNELMKLAI